MRYVVYKISNTVNEKIYIGSSGSFVKRKGEHLYHLKRGTHHSLILQKHVDKHGIKTLVFEIIDRVDSVNLLLEREQYYIDTLNPYFNVLKYAGRTTGYKHTKETLEKISKSKIGTTFSIEVKKKMSESRRGAKHPNFGKKMSEEQKVKISITKEEKRHTNINSPNLILNTESGVFSYGFKDAECMYNTNAVTIANRLKGLVSNKTLLRLC